MAYGAAEREEEERDHDNDGIPDLTDQVHRIEGVPLGEALEVHKDYTHNNTSIKETDKNYDQEAVDRLIRLFGENILESTFEHFLVMGPDVGCGLFSFGDYRQDQNTGLFLTYREYLPSNLSLVKADGKTSAAVLKEAVSSMFTIPAWVSQFYLGAYETPPNHNRIFNRGTPDVIILQEYDNEFRLEYSRIRPTGEVILALYNALGALRED